MNMEMSFPSSARGLNFDTPQKRDRGGTVQANRGLAYQGLSQAKLQHSLPQRRAAEMEGKPSTQQHIDPTAWSSADKDFRKRVQKRLMIWTSIIRGSTAEHTAMAAQQTPADGFTGRGSWPQQQHCTAQICGCRRSKTKQRMEKNQPVAAACLLSVWGTSSLLLLFSVLLLSSLASPSTQKLSSGSSATGASWASSRR